MKKALAATAIALAASACSSSHKEADVRGVLMRTPTHGTSACSALPHDAVARVFGSPVPKTTVISASRKSQTDQSGCQVDVRGEKYTALAVYLWYGPSFKDQWTDEVNFVGTDGFTSQPYGVEAYGLVQQYQTTLDVRERNFAVRLVCSSAPSAPDKPVGFDKCAELAAAIDAGFSG